MNIDNLKTRNDLTVDEIELLMKHEKELKVYKKLSYLRFRALGYTKKEAFNAAFIKKSTGYNIEDKYAEQGYYGLLDKKKKKGTGRKLKLNTKQLNELSKILKSENDLTIHKVQKIIKDKWEVEYTYTGVKKLLINHFKVDIINYLDYNQKTPTTNLPDLDDFQNFNDDEELKLLISKIHEEKDVFIYRKLLSLILQKLKVSLDVISAIIGITKETLLKWNEQWNTDGYESLSRIKGQGRTPKLSEDDWKEIRKILSERNDWTLPEIAFLINEKYGVNYSQAHLAKLLKKN